MFLTTYYFADFVHKGLTDCEHRPTFFRILLVYLEESCCRCDRKKLYMILMVVVNVSSKFYVSDSFFFFSDQFVATGTSDLDSFLTSVCFGFLSTPFVKLVNRFRLRDNLDIFFFRMTDFPVQKNKQKVIPTKNPTCSETFISDVLDSTSTPDLSKTIKPFRKR